MSYPEPPINIPPTNAKYWGFTKIDDSRWSERSDFTSPTAVGGVSPNHDGMYITATNFYWIDNETLSASTNPFAKFAIYTGGINLNIGKPSPLGATWIGETPPLSYNRNGIVGHNDDRWYRFPFPKPMHWDKNTLTWIMLRDYNGAHMSTWYYRKAHNNANGYLGERGIYKVAKNPANFLDKMESKISSASYYGKNMAVNIEYTIGLPVYDQPIPEPPPEPTPDPDPVPEPPKTTEQRLAYIEMEMTELEEQQDDHESRITILENQ